MRRRHAVDLDVYLDEFSGAVLLLAHYQECGGDEVILNLFYTAWRAARQAARLPHALLFCVELINFELEILAAHDITLPVYADALAVCWQWEVSWVKRMLTKEYNA